MALQGRFEVVSSTAVADIRSHLQRVLFRLGVWQYLMLGNRMGLFCILLGGCEQYRIFSAEQHVLPFVSRSQFLESLIRSRILTYQDISRRTIRATQRAYCVEGLLRKDTEANTSLVLCMISIPKKK